MLVDLALGDKTKNNTQQYSAGIRSEQVQSHRNNMHVYTSNAQVFSELNEMKKHP